LGEVDAVFAPCGGGGLLSGTYISTRSLSPKAEIIGAEPLAGNDAAQSRRIGSIQKLLSSPNTIADGARTLEVGDITFEYIKQLSDIYEIDEDRIIYWAQWLVHLLKLQVEPTSAMAMEAAFKWLSHQKSKKRILIILSGGNTDQATSQKIWEKDYLSVIPRL
jgi:threo-3-hydroxy-L-aspartate ammonia-lyase